MESERNSDVERENFIFFSGKFRKIPVIIFSGNFQYFYNNIKLLIIIIMMYLNFINITPTVLFKLQCLIVQQMAPLATVSAHWSLFEFSQQRTRHDDE